MSRPRGMWDGQQQVGFRQRAEQDQVFKRLRRQDQGERLVSLEWGCVPGWLLALLGGLGSNQAVRIGAESR
jgi:hypothetical protein